MYDTLEAMNCLGEMNTDNLEKMILRLPKWAQAKCREHLKKLEHQGRIMPTFKDVINFLNDRADVANHPFFSSSSTETKPPDSKRPNTNDQTSPFKFTTLTTEGAKKDSEDSNPEVSKDRKTGKCPMCGRSHPLYRCEMFKSKPVEERAEFVKMKRICFNCFNSVEHSSRSCKSSVRCRTPECGKPHHTLLHLPRPVLKETFTKPIMLKPWLFQPFLWLPQMVKTLHPVRVLRQLRRSPLRFYCRSFLSRLLVTTEGVSLLTAS